MNCARENELLETVSAGRWPDGCDAELRAHVTSCAQCAEVVELATLFDAEMQEAAHDAQLLSSGAMWWRAQRRARADAARKAARAIAFVQVATVAGAIAFALAIVGGVSAMSESWRNWLPRVSETLQLSSVYASWSVPITIGALALLTLTPVAVYFAFAED